MGKRFAYITAFMLVAMMLTMNQTSIQAQSVSDIENKLKELEKKQENLQEKKGSLSTDKKDAEGKITDNLNKQNVVESELQTIDEQLVKTTEDIQTKEQNISETNDQIDTLNDTIVSLENDISVLEERINKRDILLKDRLRSIQQNGGLISYIEVILGSKSFGDFISRASAVNTIMDQDKVIMEEQAADKNDLENKVVEVESNKKEVEAKKVALEEQKSELVSLKAQLDKQMAEKEQLMAKLEVEYEELEEYKMSLEEEERVLKDQEQIIKELAKQEKRNLEQLAEEQRKKEEERKKREKEQDTEKKPPSPNNPPGGNSNFNGSGVLSWPVPGYEMGSPYGYRSFNGGSFHYGIDIPAPQGTLVNAAASGIVTRSDYSPSYGNVVYIYHPELNITTVYAHLHTRSVGSRANVSDGQTIGTVGNTGRSFGDHLHFETHIGPWEQHNGVNPTQFFK